MRREFDIIVHGATGYTGRLIAAYLSTRRTDKKLNWAISARDQGRATELQQKCGKDTTFASMGEPGINGKPTVIIADSMSAADMDALCARTSVVIACAGPFAKYGYELAAACVRQGTHYVDITGEFPYVRRLVEDLDAKAQAAGVFLLPCSGFDCLASDLANHYVYEVAASVNKRVVRVEAGFKLHGAGLSRGTGETVLLTKSEMTAADRSPLSLVAVDRRDGVPTPRTVPFTWHPALQSYTTIFMMAAINERIVRMTNSLIPSRSRGRDGAPAASYREFAVGSWASCFGSMLAGLIFGLLFVPVIGPLVKKLLFPPARSGPPTTGARFTIDVLGYANATAPMPEVHGRVKSSVGGYPFTAISASETALAVLAGQLDADVRANGGVRTAASTVATAVKQGVERTGLVAFETISK